MTLGGRDPGESWARARPRPLGTVVLALVVGLLIVPSLPLFSSVHTASPVRATTARAPWERTACSPSAGLSPLAPAPRASGASYNGTTFLRNITVGSQPTRAAYDSGNGYLYVTNFGSPPPTGLGNTVSIVRTSNDTVVKTIAVGDDPLFDIYDPADGFVYVLDYGVSDNLTVINGTSTIASIPVGHSPAFAVYDPGNQYLYVANDGSANVSVVHGLTVVASLPVGSYPGVDLYDPASGDVYVANSGSANVSVLHGTSVVAAVPVGSQPSYMAYDAQHGTVYVPNTGSGNVSVVNGTTVTATVNTSGTPQSATYDPALGQVYVPNDFTGTVDVIRNSTLVGNVSVGTSPRFAAYDSGDALMYVPNWASGSVSLINGTALVATVVVGVEPYSANFVAANGEVYVPNYGGVNTSSLSNVSVLGAVRSPYALGFAETGLPSGTNWSVTVGHTTYQSAGPSFAFNASNGTYRYRVVPIAGYFAENGSGNATVNGSSARVNVTFVPTFPVTFTETGLPNGTNWSVQLGGTPANSSGPTIVVPEPNGTYPYVLGLVPGYHATPARANVTVTGAGVNVSVAFTQTVYPLTFRESGLPNGTNWSVTVEGRTIASTNTTVVFSEPNGSFAYLAGAGNAYYSANSTGVANLAGAGALVLVPFVAAFPVTFQETGLPNGTNWSVTLGSRTDASATPTITFYAPNGSAAYDLGPIPGYSTAWHGNVTVAGAAVTVDVAFVEFAYPVRFVESGLAGGTPWGVAVNGTSRNGSGPVVAFAEPNGTYVYALLPVAGYRPLVSGGTVAISGAGAEVNVTFVRVYLVTFRETGLPNGTDWTVSVGPDVARSSGPVLTLEEPNGTRSFRVGPVPGFATNWTGSLRVAGSDVDVNVTFRPFTYSATFRETGLPGGTAWSVAVGGVENRSYGSALTLALPNGSFRYAVGFVAGFAPANGSGPVVVAGGAVELLVAFAPFTYAVAFEEDGLPQGALWGVAAGAASGNSTGSTVTLELANGTFNYTLTAPGGFQTPPGGVVTVAGAAPSPVLVHFTRTSGSAGLFGLPGALGYALVGAIVAVALAAVVGIALRRRRPPPSPDPETPPGDVAEPADGPVEEFSLPETGETDIGETGGPPVAD